MTFLLGMSPILEIRGALPIALFNYHLSVFNAFLFAFLGNIFIALIILLFLEKITNFLIKYNFFKRIIDWFFLRTRKNHEASFEKWRDFALFLFVAIPLPLTGAWTGAVCAFLFGIPLKRSFPLISAGVLAAGIIVLILSLQLKMVFVDF